MHEVLVNRLGGLSLPRKSVVRLTDRPDMTLDVYRGRKTTIQPTNYGDNKYGMPSKKFSKIWPCVNIYLLQNRKQAGPSQTAPFKYTLINQRIRIILVLEKKSILCC